MGAVVEDVLSWHMPRLVKVVDQYKSLVVACRRVESAVVVREEQIKYWQ